MKAASLRSNARNEALTLFAFGGVAGFWLLAWTIGQVVEINAPKASLTALLRRIELHQLMTVDYLLAVAIALVAAGIVTTYCLTSSARIRLACAVSGWLIPVLFLGWPMLSMFWFPFYATYELLAGHAGGQFIKDGPLMIAAVDWWLLYCFVLSVRELSRLFGRVAVTHA